MRLTQKQKLQKTIRWLRENFPAYVPVQTRQLDLTKDNVCGDCCYSYKTNKILIRLHKKHPLRMKIDTLFHEWAHAMVGWNDVAYSHTNHWGLAYARIYRAWLKWDYGRGE